MYSRPGYVSFDFIGLTNSGKVKSMLIIDFEISVEEIFEQ